MGQDSKIEWTRHTLNIWWGCVEVSDLCDNCYAREWAKRYDRAKWGADEPRLAIKGCWLDVMKWQRAAAEAGRIDNVFCGSMMDIFEKPRPVVNGKGEDMGVTTDDLRQRLFAEIVPACPNLLFLFLTKRPSNINTYIPGSWQVNPPANVMFGTSVGTRDGAKQIDQLRAAPGRRFLSMEPLLEDVGTLNLTGIDWVIAGGESGNKARPMHPDWVRSIRDQCQAAGVPFLFKQVGEWMWATDSEDGVDVPQDWAKHPERYRFLQTNNTFGTGYDGGRGEFVAKIGKKAAGRLLDGREWNELPAPAGSAVER